MQTAAISRADTFDRDAGCPIEIAKNNRVCYGKTPITGLTQEDPLPLDSVQFRKLNSFDMHAMKPDFACHYSLE